MKNKAPIDDMTNKNSFIFAYICALIGFFVGFMGDIPKLNMYDYFDKIIIIGFNGFLVSVIILSISLIIYIILNIIYLSIQNIYKKEEE